ncbi:MAG TPA: pyridoxine 5'-phosphate oxidase C-terminal domain-containing protein [Actinophytocola sp.]|uniref:pyridoxine 5'-phosphate oxidase C-terminal domain-containing protein n=1 Tax=Actinophytocola sp. TaxID=1872138 RepID=UPI002DDDAD05|nr:pyridoxine 5'-phosphate oxidase C-terminal domain-containing protein [Actinophytocola sp.]HEV2782740.1 pyridoxine 5'-phosphate oxidase C-terminal domain-containing protein [Actinophytocola sp.]
MALRALAERLPAANTPLPRPASYCVFELRPHTLEFWTNGRDRLHERLRYDRTGPTWTARRLQP